MQTLVVVTAVAILIVAALHAWFLVLEMVLWTKPLGRKTFSLTPEFADSTRSLAANQGLYNGFLAAGLLWAAIATVRESIFAWPVAAFFLGCVIVAGVFGAVTVNRRILFVQAAPALLALALAFLAHRD
jgi:putative membrane protein